MVALVSTLLPWILSGKCKLTSFKACELVENLRTTDTQPEYKNENAGAHRESAVEHLVLEDVREGGGVPGEEVTVPR